MTTLQSVTAGSRQARLGDLVLEHQFWVNPRTQTGLDDKTLDDLADDIVSRGMQDAPKVQRILVNGESVDLVIDGQRRILAATRKLSKNTMISVVDRTEEPIELTRESANAILLDMMSVAGRREGLSSFELSDVAERLRNQGITLLDIAAAIGRSETWVSKMLKARSTASPKLMLEWKKSKLTDEQFKDVARLDLDDQAPAMRDVAEAKSSGDAAGARAVAKERIERAKVTNGHNRSATDQEKKEKPKSPAPSRVVLEEVISMAAKRPPTSDYVKGLVDGVKYATGAVEPQDLGKAWHQYLSRIGGTGKKEKPQRKARKPGGKARIKKAAKKARRK